MVTIIFWIASPSPGHLDRGRSVAVALSLHHLKLVWTASPNSTPLSTLSSNLTGLSLALALARALHGGLDLDDLGLLFLKLLLGFLDLLLRPLTWWLAVSVIVPEELGGR